LVHRSDPPSPYADARDLLRRLISISGGLDTGLDPVTLGAAILSEVRDELPVAAMALYAPRGDSLTPLLTRSIAASAADDRRTWDRAANEAWTTQRVVVAESHFAFPLATGSGAAGVVAASLSEHVDPRVVDERIRRLGRQLRDSVVHLDTALLFAAFRDAATRDERRRLAREMHDGVVQDIAALGYRVDGLAEDTDDPVQRERITALRDRVSGIIAEVRRTLVTLRSNVGADESLGTAISSVARHLSDSSGVPIRVTLEEHTERLLPEVEGELFRIAQEAMTNAVRHAEASVIEVTCRVRAPAARITVADDGRGMQAPHADSQGLSIMRERARLVNAALEIGETPGGGLTVSVTIDGDHLSGPAEDETGAMT
jgi:signal transduction histidine kinase